MALACKIAPICLIPWLQRVLGLGSYQTAWTWLHKLRRAMVRPGRERLQGPVKVDETYLAAVEEGVRGRQTERKALIVIAAEENGKGIGRIRMRRVQDASALGRKESRSRAAAVESWARWLSAPSLGPQAGQAGWTRRNPLKWPVARAESKGADRARFPDSRILPMSANWACLGARRGWISSCAHSPCKLRAFSAGRLWRDRPESTLPRSLRCALVWTRWQQTTAVRAASVQQGYASVAAGPRADSESLALKSLTPCW